MNSKVLSKGKDFDELFTGEFDELRLITYVTDPEVLMRYIEKGFKKVIAIIGEKLSRDSLSKKDIHIIERLVEMTENGKLQIYTPDGAPIHSKTIYSKWRRPHEGYQR
jgi:esterase/lipase superfamily enzyme